jgi:hypothetical protein
VVHIIEKKKRKKKGERNAGTEHQQTDSHTWVMCVGGVVYIQTETHTSCIEDASKSRLFSSFNTREKQNSGLELLPLPLSLKPGWAKSTFIYMLECVVKGDRYTILL